MFIYLKKYQLKLDWIIKSAQYQTIVDWMSCSLAVTHYLIQSKSNKEENNRTFLIFLAIIYNYHYNFLSFYSIMSFHNFNFFSNYVLLIFFLLFFLFIFFPFCLSYFLNNLHLRTLVSCFEEGKFHICSKIRNKNIKNCTWFVQRFQCRENCNIYVDYKSGHNRHFGTIPCFALGAQIPSPTYFWFFFFSNSSLWGGL